MNGAQPPTRIVKFASGIVEAIGGLLFGQVRALRWRRVPHRRRLLHHHEAGALRAPRQSNCAPAGWIVLSVTFFLNQFHYRPTYDVPAPVAAP
jgi:hypothetical protein